MVNLVPVISNELISSSRMNLIGNYIEDGTHRINTLSLNIQGTEVITSSGTINFNNLFNVPNFFNKTTDDTDDITDTVTNRFTNDIDIARLANTSGTNTGDISVLDSDEIDFTLSGQQLTASLKSGSIDETKLDTSVNTSLDLADGSLQLNQATRQTVINGTPLFDKGVEANGADIKTIGNVGAITPHYYSGNVLVYGATYKFDIYAFKNLGGGKRIYSQTASHVETTPPSAEECELYLEIAGGNVPGADGYKVVVWDSILGFVGDYYYEKSNISEVGIRYEAQWTDVDYDDTTVELTYQNPMQVTSTTRETSFLGTTGDLDLTDGNVNVGSVIEANETLLRLNQTTQQTTLGRLKFPSFQSTVTTRVDKTDLKIESGYFEANPSNYELHGIPVNKKILEVYDREGTGTDAVYSNSFGAYISYDGSYWNLHYTLGNTGVESVWRNLSHNLLGTYTAYQFAVGSGEVMYDYIPGGGEPYKTNSQTLNKNLNADFLDGLHSSSFLQSETDPVFTSHPAYSLTSQDLTDIGNLSGTNTGDQDLSGLLPNSHLTDFTHSDIAHTNRSALDLVSGTNTGDQVLPTRDSLGLDTDDTVTFANLSGTNTGDQDLSGYELLSNKSTDTSLGTSDTLYPSQNAVKTYADNILGSANALVYKGVIDCSTNPNYPAADAGHLYVVSIAGKIGGASGIDVEVGDMSICNTDGTSSGDQATVGTKWNVIQKNIVGAVVGPESSVNNNVAFFDGVTGKVIKDSGLTLSGSNTGDETQSTIKTKLGSASASVDGYLTSTDWSTFNGKQNAIGFTPLNIDQTTPQIITAIDTTITASDEIYFGDATDSFKIKKDTIQGILDLTPAPDLSGYAKLSGATFTGDVSANNLSGTNTGDNANLTETLTAGENVSAGDICYLKSDGKYWKAKGDAKATTAGTLRMALASISADATGSFLKRGVWTTSGLTAGATYFLSTSTAGAKTTTTPTTGNFIRVIGVAQSSTIFEFEPSKDYGEVA